MIVFLLIVAALTAAYLFAAVAFYYGFKNWHPMCGGKPTKGTRLLFPAKRRDAREAKSGRSPADAA